MGDKSSRWKRPRRMGIELRRPLLFLLPGRTFMQSSVNICIHGHSYSRFFGGESLPRKKQKHSKT